MSLIDKKNKAIELRLTGLSYGQILKRLGLSSKGTLSLWFKNLDLSKDAKDKLKNNYLIAQKRGFLLFNKKRKNDIKIENQKFFKLGRSSLRFDTKKDLLLVGASLYWGEGTKYEGNYPSLIFTNSDPSMIRLYMKFLREGLCVDEKLIKAGIHLHQNVGEREARSFWSQVTNLPTNLFYIIKVNNISSKNKRYKNKLPYGMVVIKVNKRKYFYIVKGMVDFLKE